MAKPLIQHFQDDIEEVVKKYYDQGLSLGEAIGVLEIVKLGVWAINSDDSFDDIALGED